MQQIKHLPLAIKSDLWLLCKLGFFLDNRLTCCVLVQIETYKAVEESIVYVVSTMVLNLLRNLY